MRVVATAGHVDHGKSTLVLALTGTDPDRFPEEKARGLTIDLGFAFCTLPSGREIGFVDVPGHRRFIKNMLAGVGAVDIAVLVVAANEGWMPQTEEHLRILDLLGIHHGVVIVTKADLVDDDALELAELEIAERLVGTTYAGLEVVTCAARSGRGLDDVRAALDRALAAAPAARDDDRPRLWIDRVFAAKGAGTVVTGTLTGGALSAGDELVVRGTTVRVRGIEQHGTASDRAKPGERVALNLVGVDHTDLTRGDALVRAGQWRAVDVVDGRVALIPGAELRARSRLVAAVGSGEYPVWCRRLDDRFVRLGFATPLPLAPGDRLVLRDTGAEATIAGVEVLDVDPTTRATDTPERLELGLPQRLLATEWLPIDGLDARSGQTPDAIRTALLDIGGEVIGAWIVDGGIATDARIRLGDVVTNRRRDDPVGEGVPLGEAARTLGLTVEQVEALVATDATLVDTHGHVREGDRSPSAATSPAGQALLAQLETSPFAPPAPDDVTVARALTREGVLVEVNGIYFTADALDLARQRIVEELRHHASVTIADARNVLGSTRKYVVPIMNHLDATGITRRRGDDRIPGPRSGLEP